MKSNNNTKSAYARRALLFASLISISLTQAQVWQPLGPSPLNGGGSEGIPNTPAVGAIHAIAAHPTNANIMYIAAVNGGIWKTTNATSASPTWTPQTDHLPSTSMSDVQFDKTDASGQTLIASFGRYSSLASFGGSRAGVIRTTDGGNTWNQLSPSMVGKNISSVEARGSTLLASVNIADDYSCENIGIFRSTNTGASWSQVGEAQGITVGESSALVADPANNTTFYAGINNDGGCATLPGGIYKTTNTGASWTKVSNAAIEAVISTNICNMRISAGTNNNVYVGLVCDGSKLDSVYRSGNGGTSWTTMGIPETTENSGIHGIHQGQGDLHFSLVADPTNDNIVYIGGDSQPDALLPDDSGPQFPNSIGAFNYSGRIFRGDATLATNLQWTPLTHSGTGSNSAPHADSRELNIASDGSLYEADDGGIYRHTTPKTTTGDWTSVNGTIKVNEQHNMAYDSISSITISGNQDNGSGRQINFSNPLWNSVGGGDGGDVVIDKLALAANNQSVSYVSSQNLGGANRIVYDQNNTFISRAFLNRTVTMGADIVAQFITPLGVNNIAGNRLIIGGGNAVYESMDQGDTLVEIGDAITINGFNGNTIAYGAIGNVDILYIGADFNKIYVRTSSGAGGLVDRVTSSEQIQAVAVNPANPAEAFYAETSKVWHSTDTGVTWTEITGNLNNFGQIRSMIFLPSTSSTGLAVGTNQGIFLANQNSNYSTWNAIGTGIPNVPVFDLDYDPAKDRLIAGTLGRGSFALNGGVLGNNLAPVTVADAINVSNGGTATTLVGGSNNLLNNDTDPNSGDTLTLQTVAGSAPFNGTVTLNPNGTFSYQHDGSITSSDQFFYTVCDNGNPAMCSDGQVDVVVDIGSAICSNPNINIPDGDSNGNPSAVATDTINAMTSGTITDMNIGVEINHTWVSDLIVSVTHVTSGTEIILIDRVGLDGGGGNQCEEDDISATLDDEAATNVEDECSTPKAINGFFKPNNALSGFDGLELSGNWQIKVTDSVQVDTGALISWCLSPTTSGPEVPIFKNGFE